MVLTETPVLYIGSKKYSSWSFRPWFLLKTAGIGFTEKCIPFDVVPGTRIPGPKFDDAVSKISPTGRVPVLKHKGDTVWETLAICDYIDRLYPHLGLWPKSTKKRSLAMSLSCEVASEFRLLKTNLPFVCHLKVNSHPQIKNALTDIERVKEIWREMLSNFGGPYLLGGFSIVDAMFVPIVSRFETYNVQLDSRGLDYQLYISDLPVYQQWTSEADKEEGSILALDKFVLKG